MKKASLRKAKTFLRGKRVLVTGGSGFVGSNLLLALLDSGAKIRATIHKTPPQVKDNKIDYIHADLTLAKDCLRAAKGIDFVFMCAANTSGAGVIDKTPLVHVTPNVVMNTLMLDAAYQAGVKKFLFISSNTVYPPFTHPVKENEMMKEEPFEKYYPVAWMKRYGEILCEIYTTRIKNPMLCLVVRPANIYGPYDDFEWETSHVIPALIRKVIERQDPIEVWGDGRDVKDLIFVDDFIEGLLVAISKINKYIPINIGTGKGISVNQVLKTILKVSNFENPKIIYNKSKPTMIPKRILNVSLAKDLLNFKADTNLENGIKETIGWYKKTKIINKLPRANSLGFD